jgi:hypothetical protein
MKQTVDDHHKASKENQKSENDNMLDLVYSHPHGKLIYDVVRVLKASGASPDTISRFLNRLNYKRFHGKGNWAGKDVKVLLDYIELNQIHF